MVKILKISLSLGLIVVILGAYTRLSDAGLGCPDWPGCYGQIIVDKTNNWDNKAWIEMIHRYAASILGLMTLIIAFLTFKNKQSKKNKITSVVLVLIVIFQGMLGMLTVTKLLHPTIVLMHLLGGMTTVSLLFLLILYQNNNHNQLTNKIHYFYTLFTMLVLIIQIALGGWMSANYAALSCGNDFPTCLGQYIPNIVDFSNALSLLPPIGINYEFGVLSDSTRIAIHLLHRFGAIVVLFVFCGLFYLLKNEKSLKKPILITAILLSTQIILGILNIVLSLPIIIATLHNITALLLLLSVINIIYKQTQQ